MIKSFSHSKVFLLHFSSQNHTPSLHSPILPKVCNFCSEIRYNLGNKIAKLLPLTQSSNQNHILSLFRTFHSTPLWNHLSLLLPPQTFFKSFHHKDSLALSPSSKSPCHPQYLKFRTSHHKPHFPDKASSKIFKFFTPRQPSRIFLQISSQPTHVIFLFSSLQSQKYFLWIP